MKKTSIKNKIIVSLMFFTLITCISIISNASNKQIQYREFSIQKINPIYSNLIENNKKNIRKSGVKEGFTQEEKNKCIEDKTEVIKQIKGNAVKRISSFSVYIKIKSNDFDGEAINELGETLLKDAMSEENATSSSEGDYLKLSIYKNSIMTSALTETINGNSTNYIRITYNLEYFTNYEQEQKLDSDIKEYIEKNIDKTNDTRYNRILKIYNYIINNVIYDRVHLNDETYLLQYSAFAAFENKTAVCQGYSTLFYKMLKEAEVDDIRCVTSETHAWNIARIGGLYYHVDSTWEADDVNANGYTYFLKGSSTFEELEEHILDDIYVTTEFKNTYPISSEDYDILSNDTEIPIKVEINVEKVKGLKKTAQTDSSITIKWNKQIDVDGYEIWMSTNKNKNYSKIKVITSNNTTSCKKTGLKAGTTYYFKVRAYKNNKNGDYSSILTTSTTTKKPTIKKITAGKKKATIKWGKVSGTTGYEIYMSTSKNGKYSKIGTIKKASTIKYIKTKLKKNKRYYFKIRTYRSVDGNKFYSAYSGVKSTKVK